MKVCNRCHESKLESHYERRNNGLRNVCKPCRNKQRADRQKPILRTDQQPSSASKAELTESGNTAVATTVSTRIKTLEQLLEACQVDLDVWKVASYTANSWEQHSQANGIVTLHQVKAQLQRKVAIATEIPAIHAVRFELPKALHLVNPVTKLCKKALIIPDSQNGFTRDNRTGELSPIHDPKCWDLALQLATDLQPKKVVLLGDMLDFCEMGRFAYTPDHAYTTQATIDDFALTLAKLRQSCPHSEIVYLEGNHEVRLQRSLMENLKAAYGLAQANCTTPVMSIPHLLGLDSLNIQYIGGYPDSIHWINPKLACIHGSTVKQGGGETAKAILKDLNYSAIYGHIHRFEMKALTVTTHAGIETRYAFSPGTIAKIDGSVPANSKRNDWQQGLAVVSYTDTDFSVEMVAIKNGAMAYRDTQYVDNQ